MNIRPRSGVSRPATSRSSVDFPQPEGPSRTVNSPLAKVRSIPPTPTTPPHALCTFSRRRNAVICRPPLRQTLAEPRVPQQDTPASSGLTRVAGVMAPMRKQPARTLGNASDRRASIRRQRGDGAKPAPGELTLAAFQPEGGDDARLHDFR